jgi:DNA modification methylase
MYQRDKLFAPGRVRKMITQMKNHDEVYGTFEVIDWGRNSDANLRKRLFPDEAMSHPAKAPIPMVMDLVEYLTEPGDTVMDVTSGTGTIMLAADNTYWIVEHKQEGGHNYRRKVVCIELEDHFHAMQRKGLEMLRERDLEGAELVTLLHGDCREYLPSFKGLVNAVIFSPPYAQMISANDSEIARQKLASSRHGSVGAQYVASEKNLGRLPTFRYNMEMAKIYKLIHGALKPGGTMTVIIKDLIRGGERVELCRWVVVAAHKTGFELEDWFKRDAPGGGFQEIQRSRGNTTVDDEDLLVFRKAGG